MAKLEYTVTELTKEIQTTFDAQRLAHPDHSVSFVWRNTVGVLIRARSLPHWCTVSASKGKDELLVMAISTNFVRRIPVGLSGRDAELVQIDKLITELTAKEQVNV